MSKAKKNYQLIHLEPENYIYGVGNHRYGLEFRSKKKLKESKIRSVAVIQMNGSVTNWTDENKKDWTPDPTIGKVLSWCYSYNIETVHCLNMWSYVDRNPKNLTKLTSDTLNDQNNDIWIVKVCSIVDRIILAYGDCKGINKDIVHLRKTELLIMLKKYQLYQVGESTKNGNPKHGRGWNGKPKMVPFQR